MTKQNLKKLRIFAISPGDMAAERALLGGVVDEFQPLAERVGLTLELVDWKKVVPDMGRPEQVILDQLKPDSWDVVIGLLWHRFGTPPEGVDPESGKAYLSGTEEEFRTAYRLWKTHGRPRVVFYRCTRQVSLDEIDLEQAARVKDFFNNFEAAGEHPGIYHTFDTAANFTRMARQNLMQFLLDYSEQDPAQATLSQQEVQEFTPQIRDTLPRRAAFFGRDAEMQRVLDALSPEERGWGVVIDGIGGIGKTTLAVEAAYRCKAQGLFDAYIFVSAKTNRLVPKGIEDLHPEAKTLKAFLNETARALGQPGIAQMEAAPKSRALLDHLRGADNRALLIFDNLETLTKEEQESLADWLRKLPEGSKAMLTSRRRGGEGALWLRLEELSWADALKIIDNRARRSDRLRAKLQRAGGRGLQQLYDETNGSPLALLHILGLLRVRPTFSVDDALAMLRGVEGDADLQAFVFQEAQKDLGDNDLSTLRALTYFVPAASFEALQEVADLSRQALEMSLERLESLSLVDVPPGAEHYALHPLTRTYAQAELLNDAATARAAETRFSDYWLAYAQRYGGGSRNYKTFPRLEAEWHNLNAAAELLWARAGGEDLTGLNEDDLAPKPTGKDLSGLDKVAARQLNTLADALNKYLSFQGRWDEGIQLSERAYALMLAMENWSDAGGHAYHIAMIHYNRAATDEAARWTERCNAAWERGGSKREQAVGLVMSGQVARQQADYTAAEQNFQDALSVCRDLGQDKDISNVLNSLGGLMREQEKYPAAEDYYRQALELAQKIDNKELIATRMGNLGSLALYQEDWPAARRWCKQALPLAEEVGRHNLIAHNKYILARVHEEEGRPDLALPLAREALAIFERLQYMNLPVTQAMVARLEAVLDGE